MMASRIVFTFIAGAFFTGPFWADEIARTNDERARIEKITALTQDFSQAEKFEALPGGATTNTKIFTHDVFSQFSENMSFAQEMDFKLGNALFRKLWVSAPAATHASDGLGPLFNARACQNCHLKDGRGRAINTNEADHSIFLRLARTGVEVSDTDSPAPNVPDPIYGSQLQDRAIAGYEAEGQMQIDYKSLKMTLADGAIVELQKPVYSVQDPRYGPLAPDIGLSPRLAPQMIGLGLVEAIPEADILAQEDPDDKNQDGISGRVNRVWSKVLGDFALGRFGHKAGNATIHDQSAGAFAGDMGLSNAQNPNASGECTDLQEACLAAPNGADSEENVEITKSMMDLVVFYSKNLAVPKRRNIDGPQILRGKEIFYTIGCVSCHTPKYVTTRFDDDRPQSFQLIWPYSDFLLHDMGAGLADEISEWEAQPGEWRTPPLWGLGFVETVLGEPNYLHDGRARTILEAILWHGGEAEAARENVVNLETTDREALLVYLASL